MLDDELAGTARTGDADQNTTSNDTRQDPADAAEKAPTRRRRRAAGRPAGPPAAADEPAAGADPPAEAADSPPAKPKRTRKKAAAAKPDTAPSEGSEAAPAADDAAAGTADADGAAPAKRTRKRAAKKAAAPAPTADGTDARSGDEAGVATADEPATDGPRSGARRGAAKRGSAKKATSAAAEAGGDEPAAEADADAEPGADPSAAAATAVLFQPPAETTPRRRRAAKRPAGEPAAAPEEAGGDDAGGDEAGGGPQRGSRGGRGKSAKTEDASDTATTDGEDTDEDNGESAEDDGEPGEGRRRRRRRGGRGRRRRGRSDADDADRDEENRDSGSTTGDGNGGGDDTADGEDGTGADGGGSGSRRRRRRRRRGEEAGTGSDDPENTVTRVRESRPAEDEVSSVRGSTRLEAKKQRRREGREAGRRRVPILSEAEFLARRESVERVMVVREGKERTQIAVLEDGVLVEHYVNKRESSSLMGDVFLGRVQNVLPSMEAAFVDIGKGRNAVLYAGEVNFEGLEGQPKRIEHALKSGQSVLVQATKDPVGHKGARLTSQVSLPGRYLVYVPEGSMTGISRKLPDTERSRLKSILKKVVPENAGVIIRTAAEGASEEEIARDVEHLAGQWEAIQKKAKKANAPAVLHGEPDLTIRVVRDVFNSDFGSLVVSGDGAWAEIESYVGSAAPDLVPRLSRWTSGDDVFAAHRVDEQILKALDRKVWLPSGGSLVIDRTEAMTVVDVNTGKFTGKGGNLEETVTRNNLEAAEEIVRQLRLRDIGGIIVVDFIDMVLEANRELVLRRLVECLGRDRTKHQVAEVTSLGLVQMTRKRVGQGLVEAFSTACEPCNGRGILIRTDGSEPARNSAGAGKADEAEAEGTPKPGPRRRRRARGGGDPAEAEASSAETPPVEAEVAGEAEVDEVDEEDGLDENAGRNAKAGKGRAARPRAAKDKADPEQTEPEQTDQDQTDPGKADQAEAAADDAGSDGADPAAGEATVVRPRSRRRKAAAAAD